MYPLYLKTYIYRAFDNFGIAALHVFVLLTTENYPELMLPAFNITEWSFIYFGSFLYVGVFFLTSIVLAIVVDSYWYVGIYITPVKTTMSLFGAA